MRILDRFVAALLAAALATFGVITIIEIVYAAANDGEHLVIDWPAFADVLARNRWSDAGPRIFGAVVIVLGLLLCALGLRRGRFTRLPTRPLTPAKDQRPDAETTATFVRRGALARSLRGAVESVDGVRSAKVRYGRRQVTVRVGLRPRTSEAAPEKVAAAAARHLASFDLVPTPPVTVRVSGQDGGGRRRQRGERGIVPEAPTKPTPTEPTITEPTITEPTISGPTISGPTATATEPAATAPEPAATAPEPAVTAPEPAATAPEPSAPRSAVPSSAVPSSAVPGRRVRRPFVARVDRFDRVLLSLLGVVLLAGGLVVLLAGLGVFGTDTENAPTLTASTRSFADDHGWFWPIVAVGAGLVTLASLAWLATQLTTGRLRRLWIADDETGSAYVDGSGVALAVADDAGRDDGVRLARAAVLGSSADPLVRLVLTMQPDADVAATRRFAETEVLGRARHAVGRPGMLGQVELEPTDLPARRAR